MAHIQPLGRATAGVAMVFLDEGPLALRTRKTAAMQAMPAHPLYMEYGGATISAVAAEAKRNAANMISAFFRARGFTLDPDSSTNSSPSVLVVGETLDSDAFQYQTSLLICFKEVANHHRMCAQKLIDLIRGAVAEFEPDDLRRVIFEYTAFRKISIFGDDGKPVDAGMIPNFSIIGCTEPEIVDMRRTGIQVRQSFREPRRKILVQQNLHAATVSSLRSRSAANARHARMSCSVR